MKRLIYLAVVLVLFLLLLRAAYLVTWRQSKKLARWW